MRRRARQPHDPPRDIRLLDNARHLGSPLAGIGREGGFQVRFGVKMAGKAGAVLKPLAGALSQMRRHAVRRIPGQNHPPAPPASRGGGHGKRRTGPFDGVIRQNGKRRCRSQKP